MYEKLLYFSRVYQNFLHAPNHHTLLDIRTNFLQLSKLSPMHSLKFIESFQRSLIWINILFQIFFRWCLGVRG